MHEYSIVSSLMDQVETIARSREAIAVERLYLQIGELSGVEIELLETAFEMFREGTICADAALEVHPVAACWACPRCDRPIAAGQALRCDDCRQPARLTRGDEIILERVELEVA